MGIRPVLYKMCGINKPTVVCLNFNQIEFAQISNFLKSDYQNEKLRRKVHSGNKYNDRPESRHFLLRSTPPHMSALAR